LGTLLVDDDARHSRWMLCRAGSRLCAVPLDVVGETMRLLPIKPLTVSRPFVLGACMLRGAPVPVVDVERLFGESTGSPSRLLSIRVAGRQIALAVDEVLGLRALPDADLPPLLRDAADDVVAAIASLDAEFLVVLDTARLVSRVAGIDPEEAAA
jgi:purine-binding chemotaxis protein CheW